jgi:hypothetical protein
VASLNQKTIEKLRDKRYLFGTETDSDDPREQNEDLGDDAVKASMYGIKNLQRIIVKLPEWTKEANKDYSNLSELYSQLRSQFGRYMGHVSKNIGGIYTTPKMTDERGVVVEFVSRAKQKEAMQFLQNQLFKTPKWIIDNDIPNYTNDNKLTVISSLQSATLNRLTSSATLNKLFRFEAENPLKAYTATEMLTDLRKGIWSELTSKQPINIYRRNLQKAYIESITRLAGSDSGGGIVISLGGSISSSGSSRTTDAVSIAKAQLRTLAGEIRTALPLYKDAASRAHLQDVLDRINQTLDPK